MDLKNPGENPCSTSQGLCTGTPIRSQPHIPNQMLLTGSIPGPTRDGSRPKAARRTCTYIAFEHQCGVRLAAMPASPPASAALPPCCHSNALRPPPQQPAARGLDQETRGPHSLLPPPHTAPSLVRTSPGYSDITSPPRASKATHLPLSFPWEKGDAHAAVSTA